MYARSLESLISRFVPQAPIYQEASVPPALLASSVLMELKAVLVSVATFVKGGVVLPRQAQEQEDSPVLRIISAPLGFRIRKRALLRPLGQVKEENSKAIALSVCPGTFVWKA